MSTRDRLSTSGGDVTYARLDSVIDASALARLPYVVRIFLENVLRRSALKRLVFDTPVFRTCLWGAKLYYRNWSRRHAAVASRSRAGSSAA